MSRMQRKPSQAYPGTFALLAVALVLGQASLLLAQDHLPAPRDSQEPPAITSASPVYGLQQCIQIALDQQPALAAHRASLASANTLARGLCALKQPPLIGRSLPIRRQQACLGITIHQAGLDQAQAETVYAVTRMYLTVLFARAQKQVVDEQIKRLGVYQKIVKEGQRRDFTQMAGDKITLHLSLAQTLLIEAEQGEKRAMAALAEAIGLDAGICFVVPDEPLPVAQAIPSCQEIIALALARRGELVQASVVARVVHLEAEAQNKTVFPTAKTFAAVSDIHAKPIPQGHADREYWPGATSIEMPAFMAGPRWARVERTNELGARAIAVVDKTRNLIVLECEDAFYKWQEAANKLPNAKQAVQAGGRVIDAARKGLEEVGGVRVEDLLVSEGELARAHATLNEALYQEAIELAALQRATSGAFDPGFTVAVAVQK